VWAELREENREEHKEYGGGSMACISIENISCLCMSVCLRSVIPTSLQFVSLYLTSVPLKLLSLYISWDIFTNCSTASTVSWIPCSAHSDT
jgi:hypothetical protein